MMLWKELGQGAETKGYVWTDTSTGRRWEYFRSWYPGYPPHEPFGFEELPAGTYRVSAMTWREGSADPTPYGLSGPVELGAKGRGEVEVRQVGHPAKAGPEIVVADAVTPDSAIVAEALVVLRDASNGFPIFKGWGNGSFADRANIEGRCLYRDLAPGRYTVEVLGRRSYTFGEVDYEPTAEPVPIEVRAEERGTDIRVVRVSPKPLTRQEIAERWPYVVRGVVTDDRDRPLPGVEVVAHAGMGTLFQTGSARTGADGSYLLRFRHGAMMMRSDEHPSMNMVVIGVRAPGYFALELSKDPSFAAYSRRPPREDLEKYRAVPDDRMIVAGEPYELDVVMVPSVRVDLRLLDRNGQEMRGWTVGVESLAEPPPSGNSMPGPDTTRPESMTFDLPPGRYRFHANPPRDSGRTSIPGPIVDLSAPGLRLMDLVEGPEGTELKVEVRPEGGGVRIRSQG